MTKNRSSHCKYIFLKNYKFFTPFKMILTHYCYYSQEGDEIQITRAGTEGEGYFDPRQSH